MSIIFGDGNEIQVKDKRSRAEKLGDSVGANIIEMTNLMYQNNTKKNFFKGLFKHLNLNSEEFGRLIEKYPEDK